MAKKEFNELNLTDKQLLIEGYGTKILSIEHYDHRINLYALNNLLIEEFLRIEDKMVERIEMCDKSALDKYLPRIILPYQLLTDRRGHTAL